MVGFRAVEPDQQHIVL